MIVKTWTLSSSVICMALFVSGIARAETSIFKLDNVVLQNGQQITGTFVWTYDPGEFEDGTGEFLNLAIPHTIYSFEDGNLNIDIQTGTIEISGNGDFHDTGLDITISLPQSFNTRQSVAIDLDASFFECCGNGFLDQPFVSGSVSPLESTQPGDVNLDGLSTCSTLHLLWL